MKRFLERGTPMTDEQRDAIVKAEWARGEAERMKILRNRAKAKAEAQKRSEPGSTGGPAAANPPDNPDSEI